MFWVTVHCAQGINPLCGYPRSLGPEKIIGWKGTSLPGASRALLPLPTVSLDPSVPEVS